MSDFFKISFKNIDLDHFKFYFYFALYSYAKSLACMLIFFKEPLEPQFCSDFNKLCMYDLLGLEIAWDRKGGGGKVS